MSARPRPAKIFAVDNSLAKVADQPGGRRVADAVKAAEERVEAVREASVSGLSAKADQLIALVAEARKAPGPATFGAIYDLSNAIYGVASTFDLKALSQAAFSLCDLTDSFRSGETVSWPALDVHVDGIRLLTTLGERAGAAGDEVLKGLRQVRERVLGTGAR